MKNYIELHTQNELIGLLDMVDKFKLYGAGFYLGVFLQGLQNINRDYFRKISCIMVSDMTRNVKEVRNIPVIEYREVKINPKDYVLLTLGNRYTETIYTLLKDTRANIVRIDFNMFQEAPYREIKGMLQPFVDQFPKNCLNLNKPIVLERVKAWTCWWQGEEHAPDIVKACIRSQRRYLPEGVELIVITKNNYGEYIVLPKYIMEKVQKGDITLITLSDIIRASLLYKYGGFWMDATLMLLKPLNRNIMNYPLYTRNVPETQYCSNTMWAVWFLYVQAGNLLFYFLSESFFYYYSVCNKIKYYFMVDYLIAIASNTFSEIEKQLQAVPYNNEKANELVRHLTEKFDLKMYEKYTEGTEIQKLTYKVESGEMKDTIYEYLIKRNM